MIAMLCTLESFVGILFASFCGAIMFAKVSRVRSHAQVIFSDAILVRYGSGVMKTSGNEDEASLAPSAVSSNEDGEEDVEQAHLPCPILVFRVVNRLHATLGGELLDATINIVASIDEHQAGASVRNMAMRGRRKGKKNRRLRPATRSHASTTDAHVEYHHQESLQSLADTIREHAQTHHQAFVEDPDGKVVPRRIFSKLEVESPDHPFFKRQWLVRHVLNEHSPLLTEEARRIIRMNGGFWPTAMNDHASVRAATQFDQILVSLSGTSNVDANSVYAQKVYDYDDMHIGYSFVNLLYRDENTDHLHVDPTKINDVIEQHGGGGEPLHMTERHSGLGEMLVL